MTQVQIRCPQCGGTGVGKIYYSRGQRFVMRCTRCNGCGVVIEDDRMSTAAQISELMDRAGQPVFRRR